MPPSNSNNGGNNATPPRQPIQRAERVRNQRRVRPPQSGNMGTVKRSLEYAFDRQAAKQRFTPVLNELLKRYRAAVKIQSAVRGMLSRHEVYKPFGIAYYAGHKRFYTTAVAQAAQAAQAANPRRTRNRSPARNKTPARNRNRNRSPARNRNRSPARNRNRSPSRNR